MKLPDVNVLVSAVHQQALHHLPARRWLEAAFHSSRPVALTWAALLGFIRVSTRRGIFEQPLSVEAAFGAVVTYGCSTRMPKQWCPVGATRPC